MKRGYWNIFLKWKLYSSYVTFCSCYRSFLIITCMALALGPSSCSRWQSQTTQRYSLISLKNKAISGREKNYHCLVMKTFNSNLKAELGKATLVLSHLMTLYSQRVVCHPNAPQVKTWLFPSQQVCSQLCFLCVFIGCKAEGKEMGANEANS